MRWRLAVAALTLFSFAASAQDGGALPVAVPPLLHYRAFITDQGAPIDPALFASIDVSASDGVNPPLWHKHLLATNPEVRLQTGVLDVDLGQGDASNYLADALAQIQGASGTPTVDVTVGLTTGDTIHLTNVIRSVPFAAYAQSVVGSIPGSQISPGSLPGTAATNPFAVKALSATTGSFTSVQASTVASPGNYSLGGNNNSLYGTTNQYGPMTVNGNLTVTGTYSGKVPFSGVTGFNTSVSPFYAAESAATTFTGTGVVNAPCALPTDIAISGGCFITAGAADLMDTFPGNAYTWTCAWINGATGTVGYAWAMCLRPQ